jgi:murein DD-endopeptidase MepM/ murein hydrolase activator NlpD
MLRSALVLLGVLAVWSSLVTAEPTLEGPFIQGGMVVGQAPAGSRITHDGRQVRVSPEGVFVIGFGRDAPAESVLEWTAPDGQSQRRVLTVQQRQYQIQRIDGLPPRKVTPKPEDLERIRADIAATRKARDRDDPRTDFLTGFIWPSTGPISGVYGSQRILNGEPRRPHFGVDVAAPVGAPVVAPADGLVTLVHDDMFYSGGTLIIDHGHGLSSSFLHLNRILVKEGQRVKQGDLVAEVGATGRVTGAHLDWRMNLADRRIDPQLLVGPMPTEKAN